MEKVEKDITKKDLKFSKSINILAKSETMKLKKKANNERYSK